MKKQAMEEKAFVIIYSQQRTPTENMLRVEQALSEKN